ncbi:MAG: type II toxin-antitoxin system HipA family toxin [Paludibacter sp.]|nr:type II toxin-antitoxin system HipA family toxin [Paludibacter sp.]
MNEITHSILAPIEVVEVVYRGTRVGRLAQTSDRLCAFEYDAAFLQGGFSISPLFLPLQQGVAVAKATPFGGNFGVFNDSLPDGWGSLLLDRYLRSIGIAASRLTVLQRLALVGSTGRGGLEYIPDNSISPENEVVHFDQLAAAAQQLLHSEYAGEGLETLFRHGGSSGGARPKVFVNIDGKEWLVKFRAGSDPADVGKTEYEYAQLAVDCGIRMPETRLLEGRYFATERFDRSRQGKIHTVSAAGLLHADYRIPSLDYLALLKLCLHLTRNMKEVKALYRQMVFNVLISNRDDHANNFSFQYDGTHWILSPAYDLLPSAGFNGLHTTTINNQGNPTLNDIRQVADDAGIPKKQAAEIFDEVKTTLGAHGLITPNLRP